MYAPRLMLPMPTTGAHYSPMPATEPEPGIGKRNWARLNRVSRAPPNHNPTPITMHQATMTQPVTDESEQMKDHPACRMKDCNEINGDSTATLQNYSLSHPVNAVPLPIVRGFANEIPAKILIDSGSTSDYI